MAGVGLAVRGRVAAGGGPIEAGRACLCRGDETVARTAIGADGDFRLEASDLVAGRYQLLILVSGLDGWRRELEIGAEPEDRDLGELVLRPSEHAPGVRGQAWDVLGDRPVLGGLVTLVRDDVAVERDDLDADGRFAFDLTCRRPLPPGPYALVVDAPGFVAEPHHLLVTANVTSYERGRVELRRTPGPAPKS